MLRHADAFRLALQSLLAQRRRSALICLATGIGVAAVVLLTALGDGARRFVTGEFASLGTNLLIVIPGRNETVGGPPPIMGETPRDLTLGDAIAVGRLPAVSRVVPVMVGTANVSTLGGTEREATMLGVTSDMLDVRHLELGQGRFLPELPPDRAAAVCVLGPKLARELFENASPLGQWLRVGDRRFRVVGILADTGVSVGQDFNDMVQVPVASAQALLDSEGLFRVMIEVRPGAPMTQTVEDVRRLLSARHDGEDDVTLITQDSVVATFDRILRALTLALSGISAVSLIVAGILVMNVMLVTVAQRRAEIGLLKALGARLDEVRTLFLFEAVLLTSAGAAAGVLLGHVGAFVVGALYPTFPVAVPWWGTLSALVTSVAFGLVFGTVPARRAARLDPVRALSNRP
ncbi:MAG: ABC transporter permease [Gammaproteobacteria bacterium]|nr:ABC transporter permease [Gammaproteobacteria bacterium]